MRLRLPLRTKGVEYLTMADIDMRSLVLSELRDSFALTEVGDGYFFGDIYADYRDEMDDKTAGEIVDSPRPTEAFEEKMAEWYLETAWYYRDELTKEVQRALENDSERFPFGLDAEQNQFDEDFIEEHVSFHYPEKHFLDQDMFVNIYIDSGDRNYDFTLNSVYPCWYGREEDRIESKAGIVWLAKSQGYGKRQLQRALKYDEYPESPEFLQSLRAELLNLPSHMSTVTFLVKMPFHQLLELNEAIQWRERQVGNVYDPKEYPYSGYILLDKNTICGLFDPWSGSGSILEISLERDIRIPVSHIWLAIPDDAKNHGYSVGDVYGMCGSAWHESLKELHFPKKMRLNAS